jgi:hypothetical protein
MAGAIQVRRFIFDLERISCYGKQYPHSMSGALQCVQRFRIPGGAAVSPQPGLIWSKVACVLRVTGRKSYATGTVGDV